MVAEDKEVKEEIESVEEQDLEEDVVESEDDFSDSDQTSEIDQQFAELENELATVKEEKEKYINRSQRLQADFSNYKKRVAKEKQRLTAQATKDFVVDLLPIIDNFERALSTSQQSDEVANVLQGVEMIHRQLINLLKNNGVKEIKTVGEEFDPNLHEAVMKEPSEEYDSGVIIEEMQKGYVFNDVAIRPAMVKVAE